jgi:hypothetical protein
VGRFSYFTYFLGLHLCRSLPEFSFVMVFGQVRVRTYLGTADYTVYHCTLYTTVHCTLYTTVRHCTPLYAVAATHLICILPLPHICTNLS